MDLQHIIYDSPLQDLNNQEEVYLKNMLESINKKERIKTSFFDKDFARTKLPVVIGIVIILMTNGYGSKKRNTEDDPKKLTRMCVACHGSDLEGTGAGPSLQKLSEGIAMDEKFEQRYSDGLQNHKTKNKVWTEESLKDFFKDPAKTVPGINPIMPQMLKSINFSEEQIEILVKYLYTDPKDKRKGKEIFRTKCADCYGSELQGISGPSLQNLSDGIAKDKNYEGSYSQGLNDYGEINKKWTKESLKDFLKDPNNVVHGINPDMQNFKDMFTDEEINYLVKYLNTDPKAEKK
jgi:cytochrome c2